MAPTDGFLTEWYDDTEPPDRGIRLQEEDTCKAWSDIGRGDRVRWKTQTFVKRGTVVSRNKRTMVVRFDAHDSDTVIPDCKWYFVEGKLGNLNEHLVTISTPAPQRSLAAVKLEAIEDEDWDSHVSPTEAASIMGTDPKNVRRMIRTGRLPAKRLGGRWVIRRGDLNVQR